MKNIIVIVLTSIVCGIVITKIAYDQGFAHGQSLKEAEYSMRNIASAGPKYVTQYIHANVEIVNINEGGLFKTKYVQYLQGKLSNTATFATAKDVEIRVDFFSKTNTKVGSQTFTIYEFILPGQAIEFKERINIPDHVEKFKYQIIGVKGE